MKLYDEKEAVRFIRSRCDAAVLTDEDILNIIDMIFDYYDENGGLDLDFDDEDVPDDDDAAKITEYISGNLADERLTHDLIGDIVKAELDYEDSLL